MGVTALRAPWRHVGPLGESSLFLLAAQLLGATLGYVFWLLAARTTEPQTVGEAGALLSLLALTMTVATAGTTATLLVDLPGSSGRRADRLFTAAIALSLLLALTTSLLVALAEGLFGFWPLLRAPGVLLMLTLAAAVASVSATLDAAALAAGASRLVMWRTLVSAASRLMLLTGGLLLSWTFGTTRLLLLWLVSLVLAVVVLVPAWRAVGLHLVSEGTGRELRRFASRIRWNQLGSMVSRGVPFTLPLLVTWLAGAEANAGFFLAWQLAAGCFMVVSAVSSAFLAGGGSEIDRRLGRAVRLMMLLGLPAAAATALAGPFVLALLGPVYEASSPVLLVLTLSTAPLAAVSLLLVRLRLEQRDAVAAAVNIAAASVLFAGALWRLPIDGPVGAAWSFVAAQSVAVVLAFVFVSRPVPAVPKDGSRAAGR